MIRKKAVLTGSVAGLLFTISLFISWKLGVNALIAFHNVYAFSPVIMLLIFCVAYWLQSKNQWQFEIKDIIQFSFLAYVVFELFYAFANWLVLEKLGPDSFVQMVDIMNQQKVAQLRQHGAPEDKIKEIIQMGEYAKAPMRTVQRLMGFGQALIYDFIKSVIIATIIKQFKR